MLLIVVAFLTWTKALVTQARSATTEEINGALTACAAGLSITLNADLVGSISSIYKDQITRGTFDLRTETRLLNLFPETDRAKVYELYTKCIVQILGAGVPNRVLLGPPLETCKKGEIVHPRNDRFHFAFQVLEDGPAVTPIISGSIEKNQGRLLREGMDTGAIRRFSGVGELTIGIFGAGLKPFPSSIPFFLGAELCHGMSSVAATPEGVFVTSIPVRGGEYLGRSGIVVPRTVFADAIRTHLCVEASFPLYRRGMIEGPYKDRQNVRCAFPGNSPGSTSVDESLRAGSFGYVNFLIHRSIF
jgi:hypothetical protein